MLQPVLTFSFRAVMSCNNNLGGPLLTAPFTENVAQLTCDGFEMQLLCTVELFFSCKSCKSIKQSCHFETDRDH